MLMQHIKHGASYEKVVKPLQKQEVKASEGKLPPEFEGVVFDDFYGSNFFPQPNNTPDEPIFYAFISIIFQNCN